MKSVKCLIGNNQKATLSVHGYKAVRSAFICKGVSCLTPPFSEACFDKDLDKTRQVPLAIP